MSLLLIQLVTKDRGGSSLTYCLSCPILPWCCFNRKDGTRGCILSASFPPLTDQGQFCYCLSSILTLSPLVLKHRLCRKKENSSGGELRGGVGEIYLGGKKKSGPKKKGEEERWTDGVLSFWIRVETYRKGKKETTLGQLPDGRIRVTGEGSFKHVAVVYELGVSLREKSKGIAF